MWRLLRRCLIFLLLLIYGRSGHQGFVSEAIRNCKKRRNRKHVYGVTEELDEVDTVENCTVDTTIVGVTRDGHVVSFRTASLDNREHSSMTLQLPGIGSFTFSQPRPLRLGTGKLKMQMLEPMFRWKVAFHGTIESHTAGSNKEFVHASISLYWQCLADPFDHWTCLSKWQLANNMVDLPWNESFWRKLFSTDRIWYEQWGEMWGKVEVEGHQIQYVRFKAFRVRRIEHAGASMGEVMTSHHLIEDKGEVYIANGCFHDNEGEIQQRFGYFTLPVGERIATNQSDLDCVRMGDQRSIIRYPVDILAKTNLVTINQKHIHHMPMLMKTDVFESQVGFATYTINGKQAFGIQYRNEPLEMKRMVNNSEKPSATSDQESQTQPLTVQLKRGDIRPASLVGGKAASLCLLNETPYNVPAAFCVTTNALQSQLEFCHELKRATEIIQDKIKGRALIDLPDSCAAAVKECRESGLCPTVASAIEHELVRTFGHDFEKKSFAVRSSSVSEDGAVSSSAGQLETYLGVRGLDNIFQSVLKCWSSSFSYQAVEYRRLNGQAVIEPMAVIVQEMVDADVAGVLFTNDPVTENTRLMVINSAPGLGEIVVSGKEIPDTFKVQRSNHNGGFKVIERLAGEKNFRLTIAVDSGVQEVENDEKMKAKLSLSDDQILDLCRVGDDLEDSLGSAQDIEWAISQGRLYLLQTRNITALNEDTDTLLLHEFDSPIAMDTECMTRCNIGEALPGVATPLTQDLFVRTVSDCIAYFISPLSGVPFPQYALKIVASFTNTPFISMTATSAGSDGFLLKKPSLDIAITGQVLDEHPMQTITAFKGGPSTLFGRLKAFFDIQFVKMPRNVKWFGQWEKQVESLTIGDDATTAPQMYHAIDDNLHIYFDVWKGYEYKLSQSAFPYAAISAMLGENSPTITADAAVLLSDCSDVISAEVPGALHRLAKAIATSHIKSEFLQLPDDRGHACLQGDSESIRLMYEAILKRHGHRCIKEAEFLEKSWGSDPSSLMRALKLLIKSPLKELPAKEKLSNAEIVAMLKTPLPWFKRMLIERVLLDKAKAAVAARELGKSVTIKTGDVFKTAYWKLADMMVREGRLPEEKLLFFLRHTEIGTLIESRSAALVRKARRRMHIYKSQQAIRYPKINFGRPVPVTESLQDSSTMSLTATGMPVGKGVSTARACVVLSLDDADNIQTGDILVCSYTDIGWSPYFAMISGLVTEMGGLMSHGAVIAREVGIPCVVNVTNATRLFKTGDKIRIDGLAGKVQKLVS